MHYPYWIMYYIMSYLSDICLIVSISLSNFSLSPSNPPYTTLTLPPITPPLSPPPTNLLHALILYLGNPERAAPTIELIVAVPASAPPPYKIL